MKKILLFFICCFTLVTSYADETSTPFDDGFTYSGFITSTSFSNHDWFSNISHGAINLNYFKDEYAVKAQLGAPYEHLIRRFTVEKNFVLTPNNELLIQVGKIPRLSSFYNNINDAPGSIGMAMVPMGEFNYRLIQNNTFNAIKGANLIYKNFANDNILTLRIDYGKADIQDQCALQTEFTNKVCDQNIGYKFANGNYDFSINYEIGNFELLGSVNVFKIKPIIYGIPNISSLDFLQNNHHSEFDSNTIGLKYKKNKLLLQTEISKIIYKSAMAEDDLSEFLDTNSMYGLVGYDWTETFNSYVHYSVGYRDGVYNTNDKVIGGTFTFKHSKFSLDYHKGEGIDWTKHFSPITNWNSFVFSYTLQY